MPVAYKTSMEALSHEYFLMEANSTETNAPHGTGHNSDPAQARDIAKYWAILGACIFSEA